jgi:hypothetical protein
VWDIGHAQIDNPIRSFTTGERGEPAVSSIRFCAGTDSPIGIAPAWRLDNTMGGHLVADLKNDPASFFAYTDMVMAGLRVIFAERVDRFRIRLHPTTRRTWCRLKSPART